LDTWYAGYHALNMANSNIKTIVEPIPIISGAVNSYMKNESSKPGIIDIADMVILSFITSNIRLFFVEPIANRKANSFTRLRELSQNTPNVPINAN